MRINALLPGSGFIVVQHLTRLALIALILNNFMVSFADSELTRCTRVPTKISSGELRQVTASLSRTLYRLHGVKVYRFLVRLTDNETIAEDIVSDVFCEVWQQAGRFEFRSTVSTWIFAIAKFKTLSLSRKRCHLELDSAETDVEDPNDGPEILMLKADKGEAIGRCLMMLPPLHREVIDLVYYHEKNIEEVGQILNIPEGTVKTRMFYARKRLSELLVAAGLDRGWP